MHSVSTFTRPRFLPKNTARCARGLEKWILFHGTLFTLVNWYQNTNIYLVPFLVQSLSHVGLFATPWNAACQASLSITNSQSLLKVTSIIQLSHLCHPLLLLPSFFAGIRVFSNESVLHITWPKYWSFSFSISPSNKHPRPISFRMDWLDLLAVQVTLKSLLQHHSSKASILLCSAFFIVQPSHPYITGKTISLTRQTFICKVMFCFLICCLGWS